MSELIFSGSAASVRNNEPHSRRFIGIWVSHWEILWKAAQTTTKKISKSWSVTENLLHFFMGKKLCRRLKSKSIEKKMTWKEVSTIKKKSILGKVIAAFKNEIFSVSMSTWSCYDGAQALKERGVAVLPSISHFQIYISSVSTQKPICSHSCWLTKFIDWILCVATTFPFSQISKSRLHQSRWCRLDNSYLNWEKNNLHLLMAFPNGFVHVCVWLH